MVASEQSPTAAESVTQSRLASPPLLRGSGVSAAWGQVTPTACSYPPTPTHTLAGMLLQQALFPNTVL